MYIFRGYTGINAKDSDDGREALLWSWRSIKAVSYTHLDVYKRQGRVVNSVIHTLTRDSENERQRVDQIALLDMALRFNPDIIVVGEMRGPEANAAQEAARTGVAVVTTIHSMSCEATYRRMVSLCKRAVDMSDETLMGFVTEMCIRDRR